MKITLDVEIPENEISKAPYIQQALEGLNSHVSTRIVTDKAALGKRIKESIIQNTYEGIIQELTERLAYPPTCIDALECMCDAALFSTARVGERASSEPFLSILTHLPPHLAEEIKTVMVAKATKFLAVARRLDCSRLPLIPYADTLATMVKMDLLNIRSVIKSFYEMTLLETTRTAGITCLGKLVEVAFEKVRQCDAKSLETIRLALACAQQDDFFLYDVEYIAENLGWFQNKPTLALQVSGPHHGLPIVSLAYNAGGVSGREAVVTSSASGSVTTWSGRGEPLAIFRLSVHYASSLDISTNGQILFVGSTGRERKTPPAVVIYSHVDGEWKEHDGIEPKNEGFVTSVRAFKNSQNHKCCVSTSSLTNHSLQVYDINKKSPIQEYEQDDIISCVSVPGERDNIIITGSRDRTVTIYDTRMRTPSSSSSLHLNTISSLSTFGEYIFSAGLDRRLIVQDLRMPGTASYMREVDSAILSLAVHSVAQCAVSTLTGVLAINCASGVLPAASRATCGPKASSLPRYNSIAWNAKGNVLFAGGDSSTLDLYSTEFEPV